MTAFRNIKRNRSYSLSNIAGLVLDMAPRIPIRLWAKDELSIDKYQAGRDSLDIVETIVHAGEGGIGTRRKKQRRKK